MSSPLSHLRTLRQYQAERADIFRSLEALRWFIRQNRTTLIQAGALASWGKELLVDPEKVDATVVEVAKRRVAVPA